MLPVTALEPFDSCDKNTDLSQVRDEMFAQYVGDQKPEGSSTEDCDVIDLSTPEELGGMIPTAEIQPISAGEAQLCTDIEPISADQEQLSTNIQPISADQAELCTDKEPISAEQKTLSADIGPISIVQRELPADIQPIGAYLSQSCTEIQRVTTNQPQPTPNKLPTAEKHQLTSTQSAGSQCESMETESSQSPSELLNSSLSEGLAVPPEPPGNNVKREPPGQGRTGVEEGPLPGHTQPAQAGSLLRCGLDSSSQYGKFNRKDSIPHPTGSTLSAGCENRGGLVLTENTDVTGLTVYGQSGSAGNLSETHQESHENEDKILQIIDEDKSEQIECMQVDGDKSEKDTASSLSSQIADVRERSLTKKKQLIPQFTLKELQGQFIPKKTYPRDFDGVRQKLYQENYESVVSNCHCHSSW